MTLSSTVEAKLRGRGSSTTPATAVANTLGVEPKSDNHQQRLNNIAHWGYGTSLGTLRGLLAVAGLSGPAAAGAHLGSVYAMEQIVLPATGASPPAWTWGAKELATLSDRPIADYALLSDCRSAALVGSDGSVDWLCFPRFDSPAVFARLLGEDAGHWSIRPADAASCTRRYVDRTLVLETTYRTETGVVTLTDALAVGAQDQGHQLGAGTPAALLRHVACVEGSVDVDVMYAGRFAIAP